MAGPLRKNELETLERIARGQLDLNVADELVLMRLAALGLAEERRGRWAITARGTMDLTRRKSVQRPRSNR